MSTDAKKYAKFCEYTTKSSELKFQTLSNTKKKKKSDIDWAQHVKMDYAQNLRKGPVKAKRKTLAKFLGDTACPFSRRGLISLLMIITFKIISN